MSGWARTANIGESISRIPPAQIEGRESLVEGSDGFWGSAFSFQAVFGMVLGQSWFGLPSWARLGPPWVLRPSWGCPGGGSLGVPVGSRGGSWGALGGPSPSSEWFWDRLGSSLVRLGAVVGTSSGCLGPS